MSSNIVDKTGEDLELEINLHIAKYYRKKNNKSLKAFCDKHGINVRSLYKAKDPRFTEQYTGVVNKVYEAMSKDREEERANNNLEDTNGKSNTIRKNT